MLGTQSFSKPITVIILGLLVFFVFLNQRAAAQEEKQLPVQEYNNPNEMLSLSKETTWSQAIDILNSYSEKYDNRFILDRSKQQGPIGVNLPTMNWRKILKYITEIRNVSVITQKDYLEIVKSQKENQNGSLAGEGQNNQNGQGNQGTLPEVTGPSGSVKQNIPPVSTRTREVLIHATFFEGNRDVLNELGIDWSTIHGNPNPAVLQPNGPSAGEFQNQFVKVNMKGAAQVSQDIFKGALNLGEIAHTGINVQALFSAFEANNLGQVLASPTIKVMDGQKGHIQVGQDFSIKQRDFAGNVTDKFFSVGTILTVTPYIIDDNDTTFIYMDIDANRSTAQPNAVSTIVNKQEATSKILLLNGESTVIAGLYTNEKTTIRKGIPILKDLPPWFFGLRYLFGYNSTENKEQELVVIIQAEITPSIPSRYHKEMKSREEILKEAREKMMREKAAYENDNKKLKDSKELH